MLPHRLCASVANSTLATRNAALRAGFLRGTSSRPAWRGSGSTAAKPAERCVCRQLGTRRTMNVQRGVPRGAAPHGARALSRPARALVVRHVWPRFGRDQPAAAPSKSVAGPVPPANLTMVLTVIGTGLAVTMALSSALSTVKADLRADIDRQGVEITRQGSELKADLARQGSEIKADLARAENRWYTVSQKVAAVEAVVDLLTPPQQPK